MSKYTFLIVETSLIHGIIHVSIFVYIKPEISDTKSGIPDTRDNIFVGWKKEEEKKEKKTWTPLW